MASRWVLALVEGVWYGKGPGYSLLSALLAPLGWLVCGIARVRELAFARGWLAAERLEVPVIVVGNLSVGGTGKTPLVIWLARHLSDRGLRVGVLLRGYASKGETQARRLPGPTADPHEYGDEAVLIARRTGCPVAVGRDRVAAGRLLLAQTLQSLSPHSLLGQVCCLQTGSAQPSRTQTRGPSVTSSQTARQAKPGLDVLISDDGLQHHRLHRDLEILVVDGMREYGNGRCLPAGPLREPRSRDRRVDLVLINGQARAGKPGMMLRLGRAKSLDDPARTSPLSDFIGRRITAVAGIGNPSRFFMALRQLGLDIHPLAYPDHHDFAPADAEDWPPGPVLMTEKDAVKCQGWSRPDLWSVPVEAEPDGLFVTALNARLEGLSLSPKSRS